MLVTVAQAREELAELLNRVAYSKERVTITRRGKKIAVIIPTETADLLEELERRIDAILESTANAVVRHGNTDEGTVSWEEVKEAHIAKAVS